MTDVNAVVSQLEHALSELRLAQDWEDPESAVRRCAARLHRLVEELDGRGALAGGGDVVSMTRKDAETMRDWIDAVIFQVPGYTGPEAWWCREGRILRGILDRALAGVSTDQKGQGDG